jgi:FMN phosphatase YigB (HAD superfamily)
MDSENEMSSNKNAQQSAPLPHNGINYHNRQRRCSKVPVRELPVAMPAYQHSTYPQLYTVIPADQIDYKWECIILDLDRTVIHGKRLSVKRWRKYVENGTIPSLAENQCAKWHRHIHRKGHQMHPFIRGRTMIYYRPFTWHLLAVLDYLKTHFGTKVIVCTKAGEHYAASVLSALIANFTSANPDLVDDVYNFHDLHDDAEDENKPKKPFRLICNRHDLDPKRTLIVDDNATSWFDDDRRITNFWMPPCYGYQIHDIDNELQLLCKYLWDPIQKHHLNKKQKTVQPEQASLGTGIPQNPVVSNATDDQLKQQRMPKQLVQNLSCGNESDISSSVSPKSQLTITSKVPSPNSQTVSPNSRFLQSPKDAYSTFNSLHMQKSVSSSYSVTSHEDSDHLVSPSIETPSSISVSKIKYDVDEMGTNPYAMANQQAMMAANYDSQQYQYDPEQQDPSVLSRFARISHGYNKRKYSGGASNDFNGNYPSNMSDAAVNDMQAQKSKTKKKNLFFDTKARGSKKLAKLIGK